MKRLRSLLTLAVVALSVGGCGSSQQESTPAAVSADQPINFPTGTAETETIPKPASTAKPRKLPILDEPKTPGPSLTEPINEVLSPYLSALINDPSTAKDAGAAQETIAALELVVTDSPAKCKRVIRGTARQIERTDLDATSKRTRILDASFHTIDRC